MDKDAQAIEVCGTIDELSASLGMVRTEELSPPLETILLRIQQELITFCSDIAADSAVPDSAMIASEHVRQLESDIDRIASELPPLTRFIIPGENRTSALLHLSRTICRRAERRLTTLCRTENLSPHLLVFLNRLGDLLFVLARKALDESRERNEV
jgi:cob(I)alamin adenosyltransferase